jgi:hypothetical protein
MSASEIGQWRPMATAPKDGSRIIVVIRASEQGPADVDVVRWDTPKRNADACWTSTDSSHDCAIVYEDWEVSFWMALPSSVPPVKAPGLLERLPLVPIASEEIGGSGI